ncbi:MAG TPA: FadR/GntR family transcriptional regulator [Bryobacteraceae bacterium]|nr:FadR/GntR family transcriptional regulator [Bryobacteraceae bacterium]
MDSLKPVSRLTLGHQVATQLASMITSGRWRPGDKLPPEAELCKVLHIGRSTLREALKSLAFVGLVRMRHGEGTFVEQDNAHLLERILAKGLIRTEKAIADVCEARMILETELAALCAERITEEEVQDLREIVARMGDSLEAQDTQFEDLDLRFHMELAAFSKNPVLQQLMNPIRDLVREWIVKSQQLPGLRLNAHQQHQMILEALAQHKPDRARRAMRDHLETFLRAVSLLEKVSVPGIDGRPVI